MTELTVRSGDTGAPPLSVALATAVAALAGLAYYHLVLYHDYTMPLSYGLPLLLGLWFRRRWLLAGMTATCIALAVAEVWAGSEETMLRPELRTSVFIARTVTVLLTGGVIDFVNAMRSRLESANRGLERANGELAAREEEISRQNEELQSQAEELRQQNEELQSQAEELEQQGEEVQSQAEELRLANEELAKREQVLQTLLESARSLAGEQQVLTRLCQALLEMAGDPTLATAVVEKRGDQVLVCAHAGFGAEGPTRTTWPAQRSFAALVMERRQTGYLEDVTMREDLEIPQPAQGPPLRSILAAAILDRGTPIGAVEVYSPRVQGWTDEQFRLAGWVAGQASLILETIRLQQDLAQRRREAEEASLRKTQFLAGISHDIRTPANAITLMAELITRTVDDPASQAELPQMARELQANSRSLVDLVSDVLDMARLDSGRYELNQSTFELVPAIEAEVRQLLPVARERGLQLSVEARSGVVWLHSDRMKLARVLANLIGNGIKFTETGSVQVVVEPGSGGGIDVRVIDTGIGIPPEQLGRIFDEFTQLRNPERDRSKGTGLGLAICRRLAQAMGCVLSVHSAVGQGSTFTFSIPSWLVVPPPVQALPAPAPASPAASTPLQGLRVLLVEDHDTTRRTTARLLTAQGAVVLQAPRGRTAMEILNQDHVEAVLLDLMLPDVDGREVLRAIRQSRPPALRCVLAVTGDATPARLAEVQALGADGVIFKPIRLQAVVQQLMSLCGRAQGHEQQ